MTALALQLQSNLSGTADPLFENLQSVGIMNPNPTPPSLDVYPANPFQDALTFGRSNYDFNLLVRARVSTADHEAGQRLLLQLLDTNSTTSVVRAVKSDKTLGGKVSSLAVIAVTGLEMYRDMQGTDGAYMGSTWTLRIMP